MVAASGWHRVNRNSPASKARQARYNTAEHKAARAEGIRLVAAGLAICWRCRRPITPGTEWHVGHSDDGQHIMGPEHARSCNLKVASKKGARVRNLQRLAPTATRRQAPRDFV